MSELDERIRLDYDQTTDLLRTLTDVRFKRPGRTVRLFGIAPTGHDRGLALVYGAALAGWSYLFGWGGLHALGVGNAKETGAAIGVALGLVVIVELLRIDVRPEETGATKETVRGT